MAAVSFSKKYLSKLVGNLSYEKIAQQATKLGVEVEGVDEEEIHLQVTANRPDLLDIAGFARALKNFMHKSKKFEYKLENAVPYLKINVGKNAERIRPYISGLVAKNISFDDESLTHLLNFSDKFSDVFGRHREKLAIGLHNLDTIDNVLEYDAFEDQQFVPLGGKRSEMFSSILQTNKKGNEYGSIITCHKDKRCFPALKDSNGVLALIPIINSERTKVTTKTTNVFVDLTGSSQYVVEKAADLFAAIFMDMGAQVYPVRVNYGKKGVTLPRMEQKEIKIELGAIEQQIGVKIGFNNMISLANKMGYKASYTRGKIGFDIPSYRLDILTEQDVVEDIAIAYGYDFIRNVPIYYTQNGVLEERTLVNNSVSLNLVGLGYSEMVDSYLTNEADNFERMRIKAEKNSYIKLKNSNSKSITMLRTWIIPSLLRNLGMSVHEKMPQRIFERDLVFHLSGGVSVEKYHVAAICADQKSNFNDIKAVAESVLRHLKMDYTIEPASHPSFIDGRFANVMIGKSVVGYFGELHPQVISDFGIEEPCFGFELTI